MLKNLVTLINTLPWILCLGWLAYHARKMPLGWKGLWFVTAFTAIIPSFMGFTCDSTSRSMTVFIAIVHPFGFESFLPIGSILKCIITFGYLILLLVVSDKRQKTGKRKSVFILLNRSEPSKKDG